MAIQIRRGTNAGWEASHSNIVVGEPAVTTDTERAFIGTGSGLYMELANLARVAPVYDPSVGYEIGDICSWQGEIYMANARTSGAFNIACWDKKSFGAILKDFKANMFNGYETNTITDVDIASFDNGAGNIPVKELTVDLEATQDLHGYNHPWAGGAGKNVLPTFSGTPTISGSGVSATVNADGSITLSGTATSTTTISAPIGTTWQWNGTDNYWLSGCPSGGDYMSGYSLRVDSSSSSTAYSTPDVGNGIKLAAANGNIANVNLFYTIVVRSGTNVSGKTFKPMLNAGLSAQTYEPYTNICPIDGYDEVVTHVTGINQWDEQWELGDLDGNGYPKASTTTIRSKNFCRLFGGESYTVHKGTSVLMGFWIFDEQQNPIKVQNNHPYYLLQASDVDVTYTVPPNAYYFKITYVVTTYNNDVSINYPSTETAYHAYKGKTYTTAVNVWDEEKESGSINLSTGALETNASQTRSKNYIPVLPNTSYCFNNPNGSGIRMALYDSSKNFVSSISNNNANPQTITIPSNAYYAKFYTSNETVMNVSINYPSNHTEYIPYKGASATSDYMDSFGKGVYGGTLNVTTGELVVTHGYVDMGTLDWNPASYAGVTMMSVAFTTKTRQGGSNPILLCSKYEVSDDIWTASTLRNGLISTNYAGTVIYAYDSAYTSGSDFKTANSGQQIVYELATPQTYQLSPQEVETVYKTNNLWSNGHINVLVYRMTKN